MAQNISQLSSLSYWKKAKESFPFYKSKLFIKHEITGMVKQYNIFTEYRINNGNNNRTGSFFGSAARHG